jgi:preprotein translocase subunit SecD
VLTGAGCSQALPLGPAPAAQHHLATAIVLQTVRSQPSLAGTCPAGYTTLPGPGADNPNAPDGPTGCYRKTGTPVTITSAAVTYFRQPASNQQPANYGVSITVPAAGRAALPAITTKAHHSGDSLATIVGGKTWSIAGIGGPFTSGQFEIPADSAKQALQLMRMLIPSA